MFLRDRADIIKMRLLAVKSKQCANVKNKYYCPEVFLDVVADKLTSTAVLFLNVELLSEFYYNFRGSWTSGSDVNWTLERLSGLRAKIPRSGDIWM